MSAPPPGAVERAFVYGMLVALAFVGLWAWAGHLIGVFHFGGL